MTSKKNPKKQNSNGENDLINQESALPDKKGKILITKSAPLDNQSEDPNLTDYMDEFSSLTDKERQKRACYYQKIKAKVESKNGECLSSEYINCHNLMKLKCQGGHIWDSSYVNIVHQNSWCPKCSKYKKLSIADAHRVANERLGKCLSTEYKNAVTKLTWECYYGHIWEADLHGVKNKLRWCPQCNINIGEEITRKIIELLFGTIFIKIKPKWLNGLELDGYSEKYNLAYEYDGMQHSKFIKHFHQTQENFEARKQKDLLKDKLCSDRGTKLIRIPYTIKYDEIKGYIVNKCNELNIIVPKDILIDYKSFSDIYKYKDNKYLEIKKIVESKNGILIDESYISSNTKVKVRCINSHEWEVTPKQLKDGDWCAYCSHKKKHTIEEMRNMAMKKKGECLSTEYINNSTKMKWKCAIGHIWETVPKSIIRGCWCPYCAGNIKVS